LKIKKGTKPTRAATEGREALGGWEELMWARRLRAGRVERAVVGSFLSTREKKRLDPPSVPALVLSRRSVPLFAGKR